MKASDKKIRRNALFSEPVPSHRLLFYRDVRGEWRWTLFTRNGRKIAGSGEGYKRRGRCVEMAEQIIKIADVERVFITTKGTEQGLKRVQPSLKKAL